MPLSDLTIYRAHLLILFSRQGLSSDMKEYVMPRLVAINSTVALSILIVDCCFACVIFGSSAAIRWLPTGLTSSPTTEDATEENLWHHEAHAVECVGKLMTSSDTKHLKTTYWKIAKYYNVWFNSTVSCVDCFVDFLATYSRWHGWPSCRRLSRPIYKKMQDGWEQLSWEYILRYLVAFCKITDVHALVLWRKNLIGSTNSFLEDIWYMNQFEPNLFILLNIFICQLHTIHYFGPLLYIVSLHNTTHSASVMHTLGECLMDETCCVLSPKQ